MFVHTCMRTNVYPHVGVLLLIAKGRGSHTDHRGTKLNGEIKNVGKVRVDKYFKGFGGGHWRDF